MTTRPDDEPTDHGEPSDHSHGAGGPADERADRVRGGFFQQDPASTHHPASGPRPADQDPGRSGHSQPDQPAPGSQPGQHPGRGASSGQGRPGGARQDRPGTGQARPTGAGRNHPGGAGAGQADPSRRFDPLSVLGIQVPGGARFGAGQTGPGRTAPSGTGRGGAGRPPAERQRGGGEGRRRPGPLALTIAILVAIALVLLFLSRVWTEVLWFDQLGYVRTIWTQWLTGIGLFVVGAAVMFVAVFAAITTAYRAREITVPTDEAARNLASYRAAFEPLRRPLTWLVPLALGAFTAGVELVPHWREVLLALHSESFGTTDPQFGLDVSFYVFILPVVTLLVGYLTRVVLLAGCASVVVHYLYGGISVSRKPHFTRVARVHLSVFLALLCLLRAGGSWLSRYQALYSSNSKFDGATYTDVHAVIPASAILAAIGVVIAVLFLVSVRARSWKLPVTGVVVMVVSALLIGTGYPLVIQRFVVDPNAQREESPYIERNINATLAAYGLDGIETTAYNAATTAKAGQLKEDAESTTSIRLLDPNLVSPTFKQLQQNKQYYSFASSLNVDRYDVDGASRDTVIAVRELNLDGLDASQRTWINEHTVYTHGYGVVTAYGNTVASGGYPSFWEGGIPSSGDLGDYEPRIYFGQASPSYSIVGGKDGGSPRELDYPDDKADSGQVNTTFAGDGGPDVSNPWNRLLYATRFQEMNILFSQEVRPGSQILYDRNPAQRVAKVAPWLTLDGNPYPAVVDDDDNPETPKRVVWILDGYTTSNNYPYSQHESLASAMADATTGRSTLLGAPEESNYVRNSVKAVVDAYDGHVTLYQWDEDDPIVAAWSKVFPGAVTPMSQMSADLMAHMRYPEDLFKVQRTVMARYHVTEAEDFYSGGDFWKVPEDPTRKGAGTQDPYYLTLKMPDQDKAAFSLSSVYIIGGNTDRNVLTGFLAVDSETSTGEPGKRNPDYGKLRLLELPRSSNVSGPGQVQNNFNSDATASQVLNLLSQQGSQVIKGNLLTLPVGGGLLYVQPVYVQSSSGTQYPLLRKVLVSFGDKVGFADTLSEALDMVFGGDSGAQTGEDVVDGDAAAANDTSAPAGAESGEGTTPLPTSAPTPTPTEAADGAATGGSAGSGTGQAAVSGDPQAAMDQALADAQSAISEADAAMKAGDWAAYGQAQDKLTDALNRAVAAREALSQ